ncbi:(Fe-S)-binding protein [Phototrophicus methaneseepsis]|uniref:(Fe-S)-binding protein n=1 Tax=Phototrophicus methaneseepsis TaxID=2710758 RepID=A0A7S8IDS0_9CHLR|nr:(Fe-S)-binding protein [Phototrophicus methaneseepsis]QPC82920.1 (Fe-S)-binding protein [Phototrophicus methaneseepsis]
MLARPSPKDKPVSLFVTCIVDMIYPDTGMSVVQILEHLGIPVDFPMAQTCCGQPAFNSGYREEAATVAKQFLKAFANAEVIVSPSGSCTAMIRHEYPSLFEGDPQWGPLAERAASITWEFTEYLVEGLGIEDLHLKLPKQEHFAFHDACHGLRMLGLGSAARTLLENTENAEIHDLEECDVCCGFGGLFAVKMANVSNAMLQTKIENIEASEADTIITGDASCLTQMNGGLSRKKSGKRVAHIADVLASGLPKGK